MPRREKLTDEEIQQRLAELPGWVYGHGRLRAEFATGDFNAGVRLVNQVSRIADELDHHPDVLLTYRVSSSRLTPTMSAG